mmetsp:Transcript_10544/g.1663  ORF Transcript_10544/g.1663 Transcript_10544/m.1663 type:complete len:82 (-) Transcript_10544:100-345(-)
MANLIDPLLEIGKFMGCESLTSDIIEIELLIKSSFKSKDVDIVLKGKPLLFWSHKLMRIIVNIKNLEYLYAAHEGKERDYF